MTRDLCVLVHGFTGTPEDLRPLEELLSQRGYEVVVPVLTGHGDSQTRLVDATSTQWIQSVDPLVRQAVLSGRRVHLIGFSMGAMIAAKIAAECGVSSVTMLAPAIFYVGTQKLFRQIAGVIKESWDAPSKTAYLRERVESMSQMPMRSIKQFRRMVQIGKAALPRVSQPLCILQGKRDDVVEPRGATYVYQNVASAEKEIHWLPASKHGICVGPEQREAVQIVADFIRRYSTRMEDTELSDFG